MLQKYVSFFGLCLGFFIVMMDMTTIPLTYTTLMAVFDVNPAMVAWVNNIYLIAYAACLILGGRLGDFTNRKIVVMSAYAILGLGATISGASQTFPEVLIGRAAMGIGAGLLTPQSMAFISTLFAKGGRGTALGIWGAVAGMATASGPVVTQLFLITASWRYVMWVNVPIAIACFIIALLYLPSTHGSGIKLKDTLISAMCGICLGAILLGIECTSIAGSTTIAGIALLLVGATILTWLIKFDLTKKASYILSPELWSHDDFLRTCLISGLLGAGLTSFYLPLAFLLDIRMNFGPVAISIIMIMIALTNALIGPFAGKNSDRIEPSIIIRRGLILFASANALMGVIGILLTGSNLAFIALCGVMVIAGTGTGLAFAPLANLALSHAQMTTIGRAAAFFNCARQVSSALGGVIIAIAFDAIIRLQIGQSTNITATHLREISNVTATACLACFMLIAAILMAAAYLCQSRSEENKSLDLVKT